MRSEKTIKNFNANLVITIFILFLSFFLRKIFIIKMGVETTGLMQLLLQILGYLNLAELGVGVASSYSLYKPLAENNYARINTIYSTMKNLYKKISLFIFLIGGIFTVAIPWFFQSNMAVERIYLYWILYVFNTAISYQYAHNVILFTADQKFYKVKLIQGIAKIVTITIQIFILVIMKSFLFFILIETISNCIQWYIYNKNTLKEYSHIEYVEGRDKYLIKNVGYVFFHKIGELLVLNTDYIVISKFLSLTLVTVYSSYMLVLQALNTVVDIFVNAVSASVGNFISEKEEKEVFSLWREFYSLFFFIGVMVSYVSYKSISIFIELWLGKELVLDKSTVLLIMINLFILITRRATEIFKSASGFFSDVYLPLIEGLINLFVSLVLVIKLGLKGVILGTIVSNILIIYLAKPILVFKKVFNEKSKKYLLVCSKYLILSASILIFSDALINIPIEIKNYFDWLIFVLLHILSVTVISVVVFSIDSSFRKMLKRILSICKNA